VPDHLGEHVRAEGLQEDSAIIGADDWCELPGAIDGT